MSILIKGIDMPKSCGECRFESAQYVNNYCRRTFCSLGADYEHCPLVEIPTPHGRLIDASELDKCWEEKEDISEDVDYKILYKCVLAISKYAPTMLESEE